MEAHRRTYQRRSKELVQPTELEKAYIAGIVDGEGSFYFSTKKKYWMFSLHMTDLKTVEWVHDKIGATQSVTHSDNSARGGKISYKFQLSKHQTIDLIKIVGPYLVTKRDLAYQIWQESLDDESTHIDS